MNRIRRKNLEDIIQKLEDIKTDLELLKDEEEEYRDNIPDNLQGSERYEKADVACDSLTLAFDSLEETVSYIEDAVA